MTYLTSAAHFGVKMAQMEKRKKVNFPLPTYISQKDRFQIFFSNIPGLESCFFQIETQYAHVPLLLALASDFL